VRRNLGTLAIEAVEIYFLSPGDTGNKTFNVFQWCSILIGNPYSMNQANKHLASAE
jgi:hypothetical protein